MTEATKSKRLWGALEQSVITGKGIDIGCGNDRVTESARGFDLEDGDANHITKHVTDTFDFVFASHCLEHMHEPRKAVLEWWKLVKPGGHLFFLVPDEDLYEQGIFPSRFNPDHKATFTVSKYKSWSPVSINVCDLVASLPDAQLISLVLQDDGYDRRRYRHGRHGPVSWLARQTVLLTRGLARRGWRGLGLLERASLRFVRDQTLKYDVVAQIQCIVRKVR